MKPLFAFALSLILGSSVAYAYSNTDLPGLSDDSDYDPVRDFQNSLNNSLLVVSDFIAQTQQGKNLSDFALGMFVSKLLGTLSSQDKVITRHIYSNDRFTEGYLIEVFQNHALDEIAYFSLLSKTAATPQQAI